MGDCTITFFTRPTYPKRPLINQGSIPRYYFKYKSDPFNSTLKIQILAIRY